MAKYGVVLKHFLGAPGATLRHKFLLPTKHLKWEVVLGALLLLILAAGTAHAVDVGNLEIHGYGFQGVLLSNGNKFALPDSASNPMSRVDNKGSFDYTNLSLVFSDRVTPQDTIWAQLDGNGGGVSLDFSFIDHKFNDNLRARAGQIKLPTGLYNDIHDVKFLQLSTVEPFMYFGKLLVHEVYRGAGANYKRDIRLGGSIVVDVFTGEFVNDHEQQSVNYRTMYGTQLTYNTPLDGLKFVMSALKQQKEELDGFGKPTGVHGSEKNYMASVDYVNNSLDLKSEFFYENGARPLTPTAYSYYLQAGYTFSDKLTPFARYDYIVTDTYHKGDPAFYQKDVVVGAGYKINSYISFKIENHFMNGYAVPTALGHGDLNVDFLAENPNVKKRWGMTAASVNFIF